MCQIRDQLNLNGRPEGLINFVHSRFLSFRDNYKPNFLQYGLQKVCPAKLALHQGIFSMPQKRQ